ncbi:FeoA family protein [Oceanidesulfovibrio marinus]|nr:FeoA family protein [Oceanidesulfovibrio marinus]QJT09691.1 ferrous iron transport protein A [Oceanidesulfovibrio marinus]
MRNFRFFTFGSDDGPDKVGSGHRHHKRRRRHGCGKPCCEQPAGVAHPDAKPLPDFRAGETVLVDRIERGRMACRLYAMGFTPGTALVIESPGRSAVRCSVRGSSIVIGRGQADKILCIPASAAVRGEETAPAQEAASNMKSDASKTASPAHLPQLKGTLT